MTMKNLLRKGWFWALLAVALTAPVAQAAVEVNNVTLGRFQDFSVVTLYGDGPMTVTHQMVPAKNGKPDRIVVDIAGATHSLPDNNFRNLPKSSITAIRTSQFAVSPEPVVRVVLDLAHSAAYQMKTSGRRVRIMVSLPNDPPMPHTWSAVDLSTGNVYAANDAAPDDTPAENAASAPAMMPATSYNSPTEPSPNATPEKPMASAPAKTPEPDAPATSPSDEDEAAQPTPLPQESEPTVAQTKPAATQKSDNVVMPVPMPKTRPEEVVNYDLPTPKGTAVASAPEPPADQQTPADNANEPETSDENAVMPVRVASTDNNDTTEDEASASAENEEDTAATTPVPDEGSEPVASLNTLPPISKVPEDVVPLRQAVVYKTMGRRDPFAPLIKASSAYNAAALPDVGSLRMVGVLHDVSSSWGLFEDANGYGYILKEGDRVQNGRLSKLTKDKAFFQLTEFGWSRRVQLDLEREG